MKWGWQDCLSNMCFKVWAEFFLKYCFPNIYGIYMSSHCFDYDKVLHSFFHFHKKSNVHHTHSHSGQLLFVILWWAPASWREQRALNKMSRVELCTELHTKTHNVSKTKVFLRWCTYFSLQIAISAQPPRRLDSRKYFKFEHLRWNCKCAS